MKDSNPRALSHAFTLFNNNEWWPMLGAHGNLLRLGPSCEARSKPQNPNKKVKPFTADYIQRPTSYSTQTWLSRKLRYLNEYVGMSDEFQILKIVSILWDKIKVPIADIRGIGFDMIKFNLLEARSEKTTSA